MPVDQLTPSETPFRRAGSPAPGASHARLAPALLAAGLLAAGALGAPRPAAAQLTAAGAEVAVSGAIGGPIPGPRAILDGSGRAVVLWTADCGGLGACARPYDALGAPEGPERRLATSTSFFDGTPSAATGPGGDFLIAWTRATGSLTGEIVVRRFTRAGAAIGPERVVHDHLGHLLSRPVVAALPGGAWAVAWENLRFDGFSGDIPLYSGVAIEARRLSAAGVAQGAVIAVDGPFPDLVSAPAIAADAAGRIAVAWERFDFGPTGDDVVVRWLDPSGAPLGGEIVVHQQSLGIQDRPALAAIDGRALAVWEHHGTGTQAAGVYARAVDPAGPLGGAEVRVDAPGPGLRSEPAVAVDGAGRFAVAWRAVVQQDGRILARQYALSPAPGGTPIALGGEVAVSASGGDHAEPAVAADGAGGVLVAWRRRDQTFARQVLTRRFTAPAATSDCEADLDTLCLGPGGRFRVEAAWRDQRSGDFGIGQAIPGSDRTGYFWFFNQENVELVVKALDGRPVNGKHWLFYGALSDVEYAITVLDTETGELRRYDNVAGSICGLGDTGAFPIAPALGGAAGGAGTTATPARGFTAIELPAAIPTAGAGSSGTACGGAPEDLCLFDDRFRVSVTWRDQRTGDTGVGTAEPFGPRTGFFWFFNAANVELVVKLLDGRPINGHFWVFYGALSDVEYTITVLDTATQRTAVYTNPPGNICGRGDTTALKP